MTSTLKQAVCASFSRAVETYESWASVQKEVAEFLLAELPAIKPHQILEIGCGTGLYTGLLIQHFVQSHITTLDISLAMTRHAEAKLKLQLQRYPFSPDIQTNISFLCADGEALPFSFSKSCFDLITSNSVFHWFQTPSKSIRAAYDLLNAKGVLHFSYFGPQSLTELQHAMNSSGFDASHLAATNFLNKEQLSSILGDISPHIRLKEVIITRSYDNLLELLKALKLTGVAPTAKPYALQEQTPSCCSIRPKSKGPLRIGRKGLKRIEQAYLRQYDGIHASYQVFLCTLYKT